MARKFKIGSDLFAWGLTDCEETLIIAGYEEVKHFIPREFQWLHEFEHLFYDAGKGLPFYVLHAINAIRKRKQLPLLALHETDIDEEARRSDYSARAQRRRQRRNELATLSSEQLDRVVEQAKKQAEALPPPHFTCSEYQDRRHWIENGGQLTDEERTRRETAHRAASAATVGAPPEAQESGKQIVKMLTLSSDPALHEEIISALDPPLALDLAGQIDDPALRNALVRRSIALVSGGK